MVRQVRAEFGPLYGLVNNAALGTDGLLANMHVSQIEALIRLNTLSPIVLTKHVVRGMMAKGEGRIVNISSIIASTGYSGLSVYGASHQASSRSGLHQVRCRPRGRADWGSPSSAVAPGFLETELTAGMDEEQRAQVARRWSLQPEAEVEDVAGAVEYLMGDGGRVM